MMENFQQAIIVIDFIRIQQTYYIFKRKKVLSQTTKSLGTDLAL